MTARACISTEGTNTVQNRLVTVYRKVLRTMDDPMHAVVERHLLAENGHALIRKHRSIERIRTLPWRHRGVRTVSDVLDLNGLHRKARPNFGGALRATSRVTPAHGL
jgi:hypothetical protein